MSERFDVFDLLELNRLTCVCARCGTEITCDLAREAKFENKCPGCDASLYPMEQVAGMLRTIRRNIAEAKLQLRLSARRTE